MTVEFGASPWGRAWLKSIETSRVVVPNPLLPKARSIARNGGVTSLSVDTGHIHATVSRRDVEHHVHIQLPPWGAETRQLASRLISEARAAQPGLAPTDLPDTLEADLDRHGIAIAVPSGEQAVECTCSARQNHCDHVLATLYTLIQRIDEHPAIAIHLRSDQPLPATTTHPDWINLSDIDASGFYGGGPPGTA